MAPRKYTVAAGSTLAMTRKLHDGKLILLDTATGSVVTLPAAEGSGAKYEFAVSVLATQNSHVIKVGNTTDVIQGVCFVSTTSSDNAEAFKTTASDDTITLNRTTTGSVVRGESFEVVDAAAGLFLVKGMTAATGAEASPFSATV